MFKNQLLSLSLGLLLLFNFTLIADSKEFKKALTTGNAEYFQNITLEDFDAGNKVKEGKSLITRTGLKTLPALAGALKNPDVNIRKKVYKEILFPHIFKDIDGTPAEMMSADKELTKYLEKIRAAIYSIEDETDKDADQAFKDVQKVYGYSLKEAIKMKVPKAIAVMDPEFFKKSNMEHEKTVIGRFGKRSIKTLVKALEYEKGNIETKKLIIEELAFKNFGGPEKVIPKKETRVEKAELIFLVADKEKNSELQSLLTNLAEIYLTSAEADEASEPAPSKDTKAKK